MDRLNFCFADQDLAILCFLFLCLGRLVYGLMGEPEVYSDGEVLGMVISGAVCGLLCCMMFAHFIYKWSINPTGKPRPINGMSVSALVSIGSSALFCLGALLWRTDALFAIKFENNITCHLAFDSQYLMYGMSKFFLY